MSHVLAFSRNRCTSVEQVDDQTLKSSCSLNDTLNEAYVEIMVRLPDLDISAVRGEVRRPYRDKCLRTSEALQKVIGVRVGPGVLKIIRGLIGQETDCKQLVFMVEECCHAVILSFTKDAVRIAPKDNEKAREFYSGLIKENIRLYNRCAAFAPGSPLVEGIEPPK